MASKRALELDARLQKIIDDVFSGFEIYLPSPQDVALYRRKRNEYWDKIVAKLKEENVDGRTDDAANS